MNKPGWTDTEIARELPTPAEWLDRYGDLLFRYALSRLKRQQEAEDVVQETFLAALEARDEFQGRSRPQTWLLGILHNKVVDRLRASARTGSWSHLEDLDWFNASGHWRKPLRYPGDPADLAERKDFWRVVQSCLSHLPSGMAAAFKLRTLDEIAPDKVCEILDISPANLWVLLHRARLRLVRCLQLHWFDTKD